MTVKIFCAHPTATSTLNVDWFEPFERGVYSAGAIYFQNLPRNMRYKPENIVIGTMPGPREAKNDHQFLLNSLVIELNEAWHNGVHIFSPQNTPLYIKRALSCVTCDIPAGKFAGF